VKQAIEAQLKRSKARSQALTILGELRKAYEGPDADAEKAEEKEGEAKPAGEEKKADAKPAESEKKVADKGKTLEELVKARTDGLVAYFRTQPLKEVELLDVPNVGIASVGGRGLGEFAFALDASKRELSPVMTSREGMFLVRPASPPKEGSTPKLEEVKDRVIADLRNEKGFEKATEAAEAFREAVDKAGADAFDKLVEEQKLKGERTPFFINNYYDANRPLFVDGTFAFALGEVYGPMGSPRDGVSAVVKVVEEREADRAAFEVERDRHRASVLRVKLMEFNMTVFPKTVLEFAKVENRELESDASEPEAPEPAAPTPATDNE